MSNYSAWKVRAEDLPTTGSLEQKLMFLCRYAILAPSVHNSQPWRFEVGSGFIEVKLEKERVLGAGDPTGREGWISLGACIENLLVAGEFFGLSGQPGETNAEGVTLLFKPAPPSQDASPLLNATVYRATDRGPYSKATLPVNVINQLNAISRPGVSVVVRDDTEMINMVANLTERAIGMALSNPSFRTELSGLVHHNWTRSHIGMPGFSLGVSGARSGLESRIIRGGLMIDKQAKKESQAIRASAAIVLVLSEGDTRQYWLEAGRAYQRAALVATAHGLHCSTTAATVEAADFHLDIEQLVQTKGRLQTVMRLGKSNNRVRHSPRLPLESVATFAS